MNHDRGSEGSPGAAESECRWRIREARPADLPELVRIEDRSYDVPWSPEGFAAIGANEWTRILVAEERSTDGSTEILGYAVFWVVAGEAELANLAVDPRFRRRGVGRDLLDRAIDVANEGGAAAFFLDVRTSNRAAITLYESRGFCQVTTRPQYYEHPTEDSLVMRLDMHAYRDC